jgi:OOP family OmpA-OmpF porin
VVKLAAVAPAPAPTATSSEPVAEPEAPVAQVVRVELDVKFDFDKSVKPNSYGDIKTWLTS